MTKMYLMFDRKDPPEKMAVEEGPSEKVRRRRSAGEGPTKKICWRRWLPKKVPIGEGPPEKILLRRSDGEGPTEKV